MSERLQVGGDHYSAINGYEHWDWAIDTGLGYLDGCATKYISRWWKKNGIQDLLKARTYILKMITNFDAVYALSIEPPHNIDKLNANFQKANQLPDLEYEICCILSDWQTKDQLEFAVLLLDRLIQDAQKAMDLGAGVVPRGGAAALPCGGAGGIGMQAVPTSTSTEVSSKGVSGMKHPFGYDE